MTTKILRPFLVRLLSSSLCSATASRPSPPDLWLSVPSTKSWISRSLLETSMHSISSGHGVGFQARGGLPCCPFGLHSPSRNCRQVESSSNGGPTQALLAEHGEELSNEEEWEGLEKWPRGGGVVHKLARVDASVVVEVGAVIHSRAKIGAHTQISSGCVVGSHVVIGSHNKLGFNVAVQNSSVGNSCVLHSGVCIGQDGFGFTVNDRGEVVKKPQMLRVQIGNNVEIGANSCIDRGSWRDTIIGDHTKIDNLVQIGHNVVIGRCCMLCGQVGVAGSATLGDYVVMGGKSGVADHMSVASKVSPQRVSGEGCDWVQKVRIAAKSAVTTNITKPGDYAGFPAVPAKEWRRSVVHFRKITRVS